ncbi:MAG: small ribosomal subunit Rsm22 family protein [Chloroherpetonaceae bacterium]|nr:small ribosomal subunit Rsm22 family protein [Chloroherpetonaceae bacterium]
MRECFLEGRAGEQDYWSTRRLLELYDQTFAQRIAWKWQYVLAELMRLGWKLPDAPLLDWGCGTGIAARVVLRTFSIPQPKLWLYDRSPLAVEVATNKIRQEYPNVSILPFEAHKSYQGTVLLSHIITELSEEAQQALLTKLREATAVLWVESGDYRASRKLIDVRESLRAAFQVVAPCTHQSKCGLLAEKNKVHWCHHFAKPPAEAFTDERWAVFKQKLGIDLSDLPLSYLVLDKRSLSLPASGVSRMIGRVRLYKGYALLLVCSADGVAEYRLQERELKEAYRQIKKGKLDTLLRLSVAEGEIRALQAISK